MITIIGNGESRKDIEINKLKGFKVGCNGIYLHENVDLLCAMDTFWRDKIIKETKTPLISRLHNNAYQNTLELFNKTWINTNCAYRGYCSGITALDFVCFNKKDNIYLIGFDFDYKGDKVNHIYKDTPYHPKSDKPAQSESLFLKQCISVMKRYPKHRFFWVSDSDFLIKMRNVNKITIEEFKKVAYQN